MFGLWLLFGLGRTVVGLVVKGSLLKGFNSGFTLTKFPCWLITLPGEGGDGDDHDSDIDGDGDDDDGDDHD